MTDGLFGYTRIRLAPDGDGGWEATRHYRNQLIVGSGSTEATATIDCGEQMQQLDERAQAGDGS